MATDVDGTASERLRRAGQRYTGGRRALVGVLARSERPLTVEEVLAAQPGTPRSSAYRNLSALEQAGVVRRLQVSDDFARYELAEDLTDHHHHLVCLRCGSVADFHAPSGLERTMATAIDEIVEVTGFRPESHRLDLVGYCAACA